MEIKLIAYGIAKDILNGNSLGYELPNNASIKDLKQSLIQDFAEFEKLKSLRFAINEDYRNDDHIIQPNDEVVIIPPVSGG